jgi:DNA polymerase-3 subunit delta'
MPFRAVAGHHRILTLLSRAIARKTLPPAFLLAGPHGIGKRPTAVAIAQTLNCLEPSTGPGPIGDFEIDACGTCVACRRIARGVHPDVIVIEPGDMGSIKIEQVRDVIDRAGYRPFEGRRRVVIVDDADAMRHEAQNALLKTLEEPPSASVFILVSSMPDALLPTVRSRCPRLRFGPLSASEIAHVLIRDHGYGDTDARAAAADADGSVGRALAAESMDLAEAREIAKHVLEQTARVTDPSHRIEAAKELTAKKGTPRPGSGQAGERDQLAVCLRVLASLLRDIGILATRADAHTLANPDLQDDLARLSNSYDSERSMRAFTAVDQALAALERNASPKIVADWLVLQL